MRNASITIINHHLDHFTLLNLLPLGLKVASNSANSLLHQLALRQSTALGHLRLRILLGQLNVQVDSSLLSTKHSMGNISRGIAVGITDTPDTRHTSAHAARNNINLLVCDVQAHLGREGRVLNGRRVDNQGTTLNGLALIKVDEEFVELLVRSLVLMGLAILDALNAGDSAVVDFHIPRIKLSFPAIVLASSGNLTSWCVSSVDKGNNVGEQSVGL